MNALPKRLKKEPLIEVIWQVQFETDQALGEVLPGILFAELKKDHRTLQLRRLPSADIPAPIAQIDPSLRYAPKVMMEEPRGSFVWQVGDRVITLNCRKPYAGWDNFKSAVKTLTHIAEDCELIPNPRRHSLRYIDLLTGELASDLSALRLTIRLGDYDIQSRVQMRMDIPDGDCLHVLQIATDAQAHLPGETMTGTIIDLETSPVAPPSNWDALRKQLDFIHDASKRLFFRQILTREAIDRLEPEY